MSETSYTGICILIYLGLTLSHVTSQIVERPRSRGITIGGPSRRGSLSRDSPRRIPVWITTAENEPQSTVKTNTVPTSRPRDLVRNLERTRVRFGERPVKQTEQPKRTLTGETSVGRTNQVRERMNEIRTGFPETGRKRNGANDDALPKSSVSKTSSPRFIVRSNRDRIRELQAERRRIIMENARNKYRQNAYLNTRGLISGKRLPTESRFMSREFSLSSPNQVPLSPSVLTSNQNRLSAFARRSSKRRVSLAGNSLTEQQDIRPRMSTDRQSARDRLKEISVSRSKGANSYLKGLLYNILRRIKRN